MNMMNIAVIFIAIIAINYIVTMVMNFLGVELEVYGSYLLWLFAIILFWGFLPGPENYFNGT
jgi:hypothetical protein|uniref:Uncharacterized protein n=1 Tax=viral metagenome TaxID=1070528 RepID=A0A6C0CZ15_9ZZZZ